MSLTVAFVGRPNVGKSSLFNRLCGKALAIVEDTPGVTRDYRTHEIEWHGLSFTLLDTAGIVGTDGGTNSPEVMAQMKRSTDRALEIADVALFVVDATQGITQADHEVLAQLRASSKPAILLVNKADSNRCDATLVEAYELGLGAALPVSSAHNIGMGDIFEALMPFMSDEDKAAKPEERKAKKAAKFEVEEPNADEPDVYIEPDDGKPLAVAIVGRPNVGKSSLLNALLGLERAIVGPEAGITRDSIAVDWEFAGRRMRLVDTAGLRKRHKVIEKIEQMSASETARAIRLAQVVIVVLDSQSPLDKQDLHIIGQVLQEGRGLVVALNKWDLMLVDQKQAHAMLQEVIAHVTQDLAGVDTLPIIPISALHNKHLDKLLVQVLQVYDLWQSRISTAKLNDWLKDVVQQHTPPLVGGRVNNVKYISQIKTRPPTFALWVSRPEDLPDSYLRYLTNRLRQDFRLPFVPIRIKAKGTAQKERSFGAGVGNKKQVEAKREKAKQPWNKG